MKPKFTIGDPVLYNGNECVICSLHAYTFGPTSYSIQDNHTLSYVEPVFETELTLISPTSEELVKRLTKAGFIKNKVRNSYIHPDITCEIDLDDLEIRAPSIRCESLVDVTDLALAIQKRCRL